MLPKYLPCPIEDPAEASPRDHHQRVVGQYVNRKQQQDDNSLPAHCYASKTKQRPFVTTENRRRRCHNFFRQGRVFAVFWRETNNHSEEGFSDSDEREQISGSCEAKSQLDESAEDELDWHVICDAELEERETDGSCGQYSSNEKNGGETAMESQSVTTRKPETEPKPKPEPKTSYEQSQSRASPRQRGNEKETPLWVRFSHPTSSQFNAQGNTYGGTRHAQIPSNQVEDYLSWLLWQQNGMFGTTCQYFQTTIFEPSMANDFTQHCCKDSLIRTLSTLNPTQQQYALRMMYIIATTFCEISEDELLAATCASKERETTSKIADTQRLTRAEVRRVLHQCSAILEVTSVGSVVYRHASMRSFLHESGLPDFKDGHETIAHICLQFVKNLASAIILRPWNKFRQWYSTSRGCPFLKYVARFWDRHCRMVTPKHSSLQVELFHLFRAACFDELSVASSLDCASLEVLHVVNDMGLQLCVVYGFETLADTFLRMGADPTLTTPVVQPLTAGHVPNDLALFWTASETPVLSSPSRAGTYQTLADATEEWYQSDRLSACDCQSLRMQYGQGLHLEAHEPQMCESLHDWVQRLDNHCRQPETDWRQSSGTDILSDSTVSGVTEDSLFFETPPAVSPVISTNHSFWFATEDPDVVMTSSDGEGWEIVDTKSTAQQGWNSCILSPRTS